MGIMEDIAAAEAALRSISDTAIERIRSLPDNPRITNREGKGFSIQLSNIDDDWSPRYHDFKYQHNAIADTLSQCGLYDVVRILRYILEKNVVMHRKYGTVKIHPEVVEQIRGLMQ